MSVNDIQVERTPSTGSIDTDSSSDESLNLDPSYVQSDQEEAIHEGQVVDEGAESDTLSSATIR